MKKESKVFGEKDFQRISKTVADPRRYDILQRIASKGELACSDLREELPITPATLSHHLKELLDAGLIEVRKESKCMHMKVRREIWKKYLTYLKRL